MIIARELEGARTLRILRPIAEALDSAHEAGLIHRDIKPQNILVGSRDHAYLADFGLTKGIDDAGLTQTGQFVGTIDYIAPEQIQGEPATGACDIYALTAVLYECLTGTVPYPKPSDAAVMYAHLSEPPPLVTDQRPELPPNLDEVICKAMDKEPKARYASATELVDAAERALGKRVRAVITPPGPIEGPEEAGIREKEARVPTRPERVRRHPEPVRIPRRRPRRRPRRACHRLRRSRRRPPPRPRRERPSPPPRARRRRARRGGEPRRPDRRRPGGPAEESVAAPADPTVASPAVRPEDSVAAPADPTVASPAVRPEDSVAAPADPTVASRRRCGRRSRSGRPHRRLARRAARGLRRRPGRPHRRLARRAAAGVGSGRRHRRLAGGPAGGIAFRGRAAAATLSRRGHHGGPHLAADGGDAGCGPRRLRAPPAREPCLRADRGRAGGAGRRPRSRPAAAA